MHRHWLGFVVVLGVCSAVFGSPFPPNYTDAPLHAVQFVDKNEGWAVGDHGTIWHSIDSGKTWERQKCGTTASLRSVCFLTPYSGWIVGRKELPNSLNSSGVVLTTTDGGLTWTEFSSDVLPGLNSVKFFDAKNGVAVGDRCDIAPSGVFVTDNGGQSWRACTGSSGTTWLSAAFTSPQKGIVGGAWSTLATVRDGIIKPAEVDSLQGRSVNQVWLQDQVGLAVCDDGVMLRSEDAGQKWSVVNLGLSAEVAAAWDIHSMAVSGKNIWLIGQPGTLLLHSSDAGQTWATQLTQWNTPMHSIFALDDQHLWAVGELGAIRYSADGGKTWATQQMGGLHSAILGIHSDARNIPFETMSLLGQMKGYLYSSMTVCQPDVTYGDPRLSHQEMRLQAAVREAGGITATLGRLSVPSHLQNSAPATILEYWSKQLGKDAEGEILRDMVLAIRMWKPEVILGDVLSSDTSSANQVTLLAMNKAFKLAADPKAFPEQIDVLGLKVHSVKKLYAMGPENDDQCPVKYDTMAFERNLLDCPADAAENAFALMESRLTAPRRRCFRLISHRLPGSETHTDLLDGIDLAEGGSARRKTIALDTSLNDLIELREKASKTRQKIHALSTNPTTGIGTEKTLAFVATQLKEMPNDIACRTAMALGRQLVAEGKWVAAREMYLLVVSRYHVYPESVDAMRWLTQYYSSGEARRRAELQNKLIIEHGTVVPTGGSAVQQAGGTSWDFNSEEYRISDSEAARAWGNACLELENKLAGFGVVYARDPTMILSTYSTRRQLGLQGDAAKQLAGYFRSVPGINEQSARTDFYRDCLMTEMSLINRNAVPLSPKPQQQCPSTIQKPFLDGKLDDECWTKHKPQKLTHRSFPKGPEYTTEVFTCYDEQFVYFGVRCSKPAGEAVAKVEKRSHDMDLSQHDRVDLYLDLDRDYQSYYRLQVDERGAVAEDCWGDRNWNIQWFVANQSSSTSWTTEFAIPKGELTGLPITHGLTWAYDVKRVIPGVGTLSWSGIPTPEARPEGMGLLQFYLEK